MPVTSTQPRLEQAVQTARARLLMARNLRGFWEGRLSSSALSTATAISALAVCSPADDALRMLDGAAWLRETQNADGGWGDTTDSPSNLATTLLTVAALRLAGMEDEPFLRHAAQYLQVHAGPTPDDLLQGIRKAYGADRTFAVPILMNCALAGMVPWQAIPGLPYELSILPHAWLQKLRLHVVSYALPALIAIGLLLEERTPSRNPCTALLRRLTVEPALAKLAAIQPDHGGFLEAVPLTAFVTMSLGSYRNSEHVVVQRCRSFLREAQRPDGSWPIDMDLSVWLTTSAVTALHASGGTAEVEDLRGWIVEQQYRDVHPFTQAAPGGWGWTHRPGGVPDGDDTSGAMVALAHLGERDALAGGVRWLLSLQNHDGGWPTFCRGWGALPFDRSTPDITAHAIRALRLAAPADPAVTRALQRGLDYLHRAQRDDGSWVPLWFGHQYAPRGENPVFGTARVLIALGEAGVRDDHVRRGVQYLLRAQHTDGGWGGAPGVPAGIEESAVAVSALSLWPDEAGQALAAGVEYLIARVEDDTWTTPSPIGLYFASLWYAEQLYPIIWTVEALGRAQCVLRDTHDD
jgi:squalene-hopene/tetraprenyl-beta-curcumene cyclase